MADYTLLRGTGSRVAVRAARELGAPLATDPTAPELGAPLATDPTAPELAAVHAHTSETATTEHHRAHCKNLHHSRTTFRATHTRVTIDVPN